MSDSGSVSNDYSMRQCLDSGAPTLDPKTGWTMTTGFGATPSQARVGELVAGRLRILRELGRGGMGAVYEVEHELTRHRRALKLLHAHMSVLPQVVERFLREASAAGRIGNPHIVETFDAGRLDSGEPYIVMELLEGVCLSDYLAEHGPLELNQICELLVQACDAIHAAHQAGIVHRDLKPENLHLSFAEGPVFVKVLDFGISKFDAELTGIKGVTLEGTPMGTPYYMCPEQFKGGAIDRRSDVYALGVVLYECLTGRRPFEPETLTHLIALVLRGEYVAPSKLRSGLPKALDGVVAKAMAVDREERYATAQELGRALTAAVGRSVSEPSPELGAALRKTTLPPNSRVIAALTPDVFSGAPSEPLPRKARHAVWAVILGFVAFALLVGGSLVLLRRQPVPTRQQPLSSVEASEPTMHDGPRPVVEVSAVPIASAAASGTGMFIASPPSAKPALHEVRRSSKSTSVPDTSAKKRSSAYGLSERNPFE